MSYTLVITTRIVSYYAAERTTPTGGEYGGEWLEGDSRELETPDGYAEEYGVDDAEEHGSPVAWAIDRLDRTDVVEASMHPIPDAVQEHDWLSGSHDDPYQGPGRRVTETTARLVGDWTPAQRAEVFRAAVRTDRHGV